MDYSNYSEIFIICRYYDMGIRMCKQRDLNHRAKNVHIITPDNVHKLKGRRAEEADNWLILHGPHEGADMNAVFDELKAMRVFIE